MVEPSHEQAPKPSDWTARWLDSNRGKLTLAVVGAALGIIAHAAATWFKAIADRNLAREKFAAERKLEQEKFVYEVILKAEESGEPQRMRGLIQVFGALGLVDADVVKTVTEDGDQLLASRGSAPPAATDPSRPGKGFYHVGKPNHFVMGWFADKPACEKDLERFPESYRQYHACVERPEKLYCFEFKRASQSGRDCYTERQGCERDRGAFHPRDLVSVGDCTPQ